MSDLGWGEAHGYTNRCAGCGQVTDSTYCSTRCAADAIISTRPDDTDDEDPEYETDENGYVIESYPKKED